MIGLEAVRALHSRMERDRRGLVLVEGLRFALTALRSGAAVEQWIICPKLLNGAARHFVRRQEHGATPVMRLGRAKWTELSRSHEPSGIAAIVRQRWSALPQRTAKNELWLGFDAIRSPGNLGTMLRTAHAVGARGAVLLSSELDPYDPSAVRATMGSLFSLRFVRTAHAELRAWCRQVYVVGADSSARRDYRHPSYRGPTLLMVGNERSGLSDSQRALCDELVRIPMRGDLDSLNVAVATGVLLYQIHDQRHPKAPG